VDQSPGLKGAMQFISDLRSLSPSSQPVLWVADLAEVESFRVLQMGARGVLKKILPVSSLLDCVRTVGSGTVWMDSPVSHELSNFANRRTAPRLTPREREIVQCICRGFKNKEIAEKLTITAGTVKVHLMHIFEKTGVKDRFELAIHGRRLMGDAVELEEVGAVR
jgi:two-component system, NarL family, nitrate/nitrite response regulator NarL